MRLACLRRFQQAELVLKNLKGWQVEAVHLARGYLELEKGDITASIRDLREGDQFYKQEQLFAMSKSSDHLCSRRWD